MDTPGSAAGTIERITVRIHVGDDRMAGTDDPLFLCLHGPAGREFRLAEADGTRLKRAADEAFVLGPPDHPDTNVAHPELNDPTQPAIDIADITGVALSKGMEPIPNVRGVGELDDRLEIAYAEVEVHYGRDPQVARYVREGPLWLGLACGFTIELPPR